jgi:hypothetical protein
MTPAIVLTVTDGTKTSPRFGFGAIGVNTDLRGGGVAKRDMVRLKSDLTVHKWLDELHNPPDEQRVQECRKSVLSIVNKQSPVIGRWHVTSPNYVPNYER